MFGLQRVETCQVTPKRYNFAADFNTKSNSITPKPNQSLTDGRLFKNYQHLNYINMQENNTNPIETLTQQVAALTKKVETLTNVLCQAKEILTLEEAAVFLGVTKSTLYKLTHNQVIPYFKPSNKMVYFERQELMNWVRSCKVASMGEIKQEAERIEAVLAIK